VAYTPFDDPRLLRIIWDRSQTGWAVVSEDGTFIACNDRFGAIVEYSKAELLNLKFQDITHPKDTGPEVAMANMLASGDIDHYRMLKTYIKKSGLPVLAELVVWPLKNEDGSFDYFLSQILPRVDVTSVDTKTTVSMDSSSLLWRTLAQNKVFVGKVSAIILSILTALAVIVSKLVEKI
jgi:PAS domain S-box-containing protein